MPHKDPSQYGRIPEKYWRDNAIFKIPLHEDDLYPVVIINHRTGNADINTIIRQCINVLIPKCLVYILSESK